MTLKTFEELTEEEKEDMGDLLNGEEENL